MDVVIAPDASLINFAEVKCQYIKKALTNNTTIMMTIQQFILASEFPIDAFMVDNFYKNLNDDIPIYVSNSLIEWCGFSGDITEQKKSFNKVLKKYNENEDYWIYKNVAYGEFYKMSMGNDCPIGIDKDTVLVCFPNPTEFVGKNKTNHIILTPTCFKQIMMNINTDKGKKIKLYYIALEKLIKTYATYQIYHHKFEAQLLKNVNSELMKKMDTIINQNAELLETVDDMHHVVTDTNRKLNIATDERAPKSEDTDKHESYVVVKLNNPTQQWLYHSIRGQKPYIRREIRRLKFIHPQCTILVEIPYQPNSVNFNTLLKEQIKGIIVKSNDIRFNVGYTEAQFIADINSINLSKKDV